MFSADPSTALDGRIVGGKQVKIESFPYQVSLRHFGLHACGGSIISSNYVLTAAHCVEGFKFFYRIQAGSSHKLIGGTLHNVKRIIQHSGYLMTKQGVPVNDIALIQVREPFKFDKTHAAIPLYEGVSETGINATISGWGTTNSERSPNYLQAVDVPIISRNKCKEAYRNLTVLPEGQICAAVPEGGKDSCQGDSGGPLVVNGKLAGIVSWGIGCGVKGKPGIYTEVAHHLVWIRSYVRL